MALTATKKGEILITIQYSKLKQCFSTFFGPDEKTYNNV